MVCTKRRGFRMINLSVTLLLLLLPRINSETPLMSIGSDYSEELPRDMYTIPGDINLGVLTWNFKKSSTHLCGEEADIGLGIQLTMASVYALEKINKDESILPNVTLGIVAVDACGKGITAIGQSIKFLPGPENEDFVCKDEAFSQRFDVVGILGPQSSESCLAIANLLNLYRIPYISASATSDDLSDRSNYWNFFRTVAPDSFQTRAAVDLLLYFKWTYLSVVFEETSYGYNGLALLRRYARENDICIADSHPISDDLEDADYDQIVHKLMKDKNARVIITFMRGSNIGGLLKAGLRNGAQNMFIWLFSESVTAADLKGFEEVVLGCFFFNSFTGKNPEFEDFMKNVSPRRYPNNPWLEAIWSQNLECSLADLQKADSECNQKTLQDIPDFSVYTSATTMVQATEIFAVAIDQLIRNHCPQAFSNKYLLKNCVDPYVLIDYVSKASLKTPQGVLSFSEFGAIVQDYEISQLVPTSSGGYEVIYMGKWSKGSVDLTLNNLRWFVKDDYKVHDENLNVPESVCSKPCQPGEFLVQGELPCCWDCRKCRINEVVSANGSNCDVCPKLTWPDQDTLSTCFRIPPTFLSWSDTYGIGLSSVAGLGLLGMILISGAMIKARSRKVIVSSGSAWIWIIATGLLIMLGTVFLFIVKPTDILCVLSRVGFHLSCTLVFGSLLVKTMVIYHGSRTSAESSGKFPGILMVFILLLQIALFLVTYYFWPVKAQEKMPVRSSRFVELYCHQDLLGLLLPLSYNLLLLLLTSILSFLVRNQPENFNEAWYMLLNAGMDLFAWIAFLVTYMSAFAESQKAALLGLALVLNGILTMLCFFVTKLYALVYVHEKDIKTLKKE